MCKLILLNNLLLGWNTEVKYAFSASALSESDNNSVPQDKLSGATLWAALSFLLTWLKKALVECEFITRCSKIAYYVYMSVYHKLILIFL